MSNGGVVTRFIEAQMSDESLNKIGKFCFEGMINTVRFAYQPLKGYPTFFLDFSDVNCFESLS